MSSDNQQSDRTTLIIGALTISATLLGVYLGKTMEGSNESSKVIRGKLEEAYQRTLRVPDLAVEFNMAATARLSEENFNYNAHIYSSRLDAYRDELTQIEAISDLYAPSISRSVERLVSCTDEFVDYASNHFLLEARDAGKEVAHELRSYRDHSQILERPESLDTVVHVREKCKKVGDDVKKEIIQSMREHI